MIWICLALGSAAAGLALGSGVLYETSRSRVEVYFRELGEHNEKPHDAPEDTIPGLNTPEMTCLLSQVRGMPFVVPRQIERIEDLTARVVAYPVAEAALPPSPPEVTL